jgi:hypothetical protein
MTSSQTNKHGCNVSCVRNRSLKLFVIRDDVLMVIFFLFGPDREMTFLNNFTESSFEISRNSGNYNNM